MTENEKNSIRTFLKPTFRWSNRTRQIVVDCFSLSKKPLSIPEFCGKIIATYNIVVNVNDIENDIFKSEIAAAKQTSNNNVSSNTIQKWLLDEIKNSKYKLSRAGRQVEYVTGEAVSNADRNNLEDYLIMVNSCANGGPGYNVGEIKATLGQVLKEWENITINDLLNDIRFDKQYESFTDNFLKEIYDYWCIIEPFDVFKVMMKQWMWCTKRKIWNKKCRHHIWLNFYGTTGFGKSEFIKLFTDRFKDFRCEGGLEIFADQGREYKKFCNNFILFFDELSQKNQTNLADAKLTESTLAAIKASVTGEEMDVRILGGQTQNKVKIRYTPISAANYHLYDIIYDETSMRRFFEFNVGRTTMPGLADYKKLNGILAHSIEAFRGINENDDEGYFNPEDTIGTQIREIQKKYLPTKTTVNVWIRKCNVKSGKTSSDLLYNDYKSWCKEYGYYPRNLEGYNEILASRFGRNGDGEILIDVNSTQSTNIIVNKLSSTNTKPNIDKSVFEKEPKKLTKEQIEQKEEIEDDFFKGIENNA